MVDERNEDFTGIEPVDPQGYVGFAMNSLEAPEEREVEGVVEASSTRLKDAAETHEDREYAEMLFGHLGGFDDLPENVKEALIGYISTMNHLSVSATTWDRYATYGDRVEWHPRGYLLIWDTTKAKSRNNLVGVYTLNEQEKKVNLVAQAGAIYDQLYAN